MLGSSSLTEVDAAAAQLDGVDRVGLEPGRDQRADDTGRHQGRDDSVVTGELEDDDDRGDRSVRGGGNDRAHGHQRVSTRSSGIRRQHLVQKGAEKTAGHGAEEQRGREDATGSARGQSDRGGEHLGHQQCAEQGCRQAAGQCCVNGLDAASEDLRQEDADDADHRSTQHGFEILGWDAEAVEELLAPGQRANEGEGNESCHDADDHVGQQLEGADELVRRNLESRRVAEKAPRHDCGDDRGDDDRAELRHAEVAEEDLDGEQGARDRCVEGGGNARRGTAADQRAQLTGGYAQELPERRAQRRADLHDRPLATGRSPGADGDRGCDRLDDDDAGADRSAAENDRLHDLGNSVALGLAREEVHQRSDDQASQRRHGDAAQRRRRLDRFQEGSVGAVEDLLHEVDEIVQNDRAQPAAGTDDDCHRDHEELAASQSFERTVGWWQRDDPVPRRTAEYLDRRSGGRVDSQTEVETTALSNRHTSGWQ